MRSSYPISLFSRPPRKEGGPSAFVVSIVLHSIFLSLMLVAVKRTRVAPQRLPNRKYEVRLLDMRRMEATLRYYPQPATHSAHSSARSRSAGGALGAALRAPLERVSRNFATPRPAPQTLIQPQVPPEQRTLAKIPIPRAMVWTPGEIAQRQIVTPAPQPPSAIHVKPMLRTPNHELNPSDVPLTSTPFTTQALIPAPGTTVPVEVDGRQPGAHLPVTASRTQARLSPARVISLSNLKLQEGTAALPVINEIARADSIGAPALGTAAGQSAGGNKSASQQPGAGVGHGAGHSGGSSGGAATGAGQQTTPGSDDGFVVNTGSGNPDWAGGGTRHITLPRGGQYGMVVVGSSPEEDYPETADLWTGRLVYTVYLQTATAQNWILQYSVPRVANDPPGNETLSGPWPYDMMRPSLKYKDVILVHGFVNAMGRFEHLSVAYPPGLSEAPLLLRALKQWVFRPAALNGQAARVEVLLIIPGAEE